MLESSRYHDLESGRTEKVEWAGKTLRLRVRPGRKGSKLELSPSPGSRVLSLLALCFLGVHWLGLGGGAAAYFIGTTRAENLDFAAVGLAAILALLVNLSYVWFVGVAVLDDAWSFEPHLAMQRLNLLGMSFRVRTYEVIDAIAARDWLVLRTPDHRDVVVRPSGWGSESNDETMPPELSRLIRTYLALPIEAPR